MNAVKRLHPEVVSRQEDGALMPQAYWQRESIIQAAPKNKNTGDACLKRRTGFEMSSRHSFGLNNVSELSCGIIGAV